MIEETKNKLMAELGELTYKRAKMQAVLNTNLQRSNEIAAILEKAENGKTIVEVPTPKK